MSLRHLLQPQTVAVIGASDRLDSFGGGVIRTIRDAGYGGKLFGINPRLDSIEGIPVFPAVSALPTPADCVALCLPDAHLAKALEDAADSGVKGAVIFSRCYDPAPENSLTERLTAIARNAGISICGHNCMGFVNTSNQLQIAVSRWKPTPKTGSVAIISHSGSTWSAIMGSQRDLDLGCAISAGGELTTSVADYLRFLVDQPAIRVVGLVLETVREPEQFMEALAHAASRGVPVVALKLGRSEIGRGFTVSHSGGLAGSDGAFRAICRKFNVILTTTIDEYLDCIEMFRTEAKPGAGGVAVVTDSGGERQLIADIAADVGLHLAQFSATTLSKIEVGSDPGMAAGNPIDCYGDGRLLMADMAEACIGDPDVAMIAVGTNLVHGRSYLQKSIDASRRIAQSAGSNGLPFVVFGNASSTVSSEAAHTLREAGVPVLMGTHNACFAMDAFLRWHQFDNSDLRMPPKILGSSDASANEFRPIAPDLVDRVLRDEGFPLAEAIFCEGEDAAVQAAATIGYPVVLKTAEAAISHKTDKGGVIVGIRDATALKAAVQAITAACGPKLQVQAMAASGTELILGMMRDVQFGPMAIIGLGGIFTEVLQDSVTVALPAKPAEVRTAIASLKAAGLLAGARGQQPADIDALVDLIAKVSAFFLDNPELHEIEFNPVRINGSSINILDTLVIAHR